MTAQKESKLDALTALRFVAAYLVVLGHSRNDFRCLQGLSDEIVFNQAVTFFFVLSGFILTFVYPELPNLRKTGSFLVKRFARLWPLHAAVFYMHKTIITKALVTIAGSAPLWTVTAANLLMVHAWIPYVQFFFSFNAPSWSISTEFFFYLAFPLLLILLRKAAWLPMLVAGLSVGAFVYLCNWLQLPVMHESKLSMEGLLYINPLVRIFEFTVGMATAVAFKRLAWPKLGRAAGTLVEIAVLAATTFLMIHSVDGSQALKAYPFVGEAGAYWLKYSGVPLIGFSATIFCFAMGRGWISRLLSTPPAVLLGDISYAVYMVHYPLLMYRRCFLPQETSTLSFVMYTAILLLICHLLFTFLEKPARKNISNWYETLVGSGKPLPERWAAWTKSNKMKWNMAKAAYKTFGPRKTFNMVFAKKPGTRGGVGRKSAVLWRGVEFACLAGLIVSLHPPLTRLSEQQASVFISQKDCVVKNVGVGDGLHLETLITRAERNSMCLDLLWRSKKQERLHYYLFVNLLNEKGEKIYEQSANFAPRPTSVRPGELWLSSVFIPNDKLKDAHKVGLIVVKENVGLMPFDSNATDMAKLRLLMPVKEVIANKDLGII